MRVWLASGHTDISDGGDSFGGGAESRTSAKSALANAGGTPTGADRSSIALRHV
jgi:hypothetical protein